MANVQSSVPANNECPGTNEQPHVSHVLDAELGSNAESNEEPSLTSTTTAKSLGLAQCQKLTVTVTVFFTAEQNGQVNKGMVIDLTPRKKHVKVATNPRERPVAVALEFLTQPPPQPLKDQTFVITGHIAERDEKEKVNTERLTEIIKSLSGTVFSGDIKKATDASFMVVTSQRELNKPTPKLKTLVMAFHLGWKFVSKKIILTARDTLNHTKMVCSRRLNLGFISSSTFDRIQKLYAIPAVQSFWSDMKTVVHEVMKNEKVVLSGDGRNDSPGFSGQYCVYSLMEAVTKVIVDIEVKDKRETGGNSTVMEVAALKCLLEN